MPVAQWVFDGVTCTVNSPNHDGLRTEIEKSMEVHHRHSIALLLRRAKNGQPSSLGQVPVATVNREPADRSGGWAQQGTRPSRTNQLVCNRMPYRCR